VSYAIETIDLYKKFVTKSGLWLFGRRKTKEVVAVDHLNLKVRKGELFGLLGPNGAGKTTTIKILATLIIPDGGEAYVNGYSVLKEDVKVRESIGVVTGGERSLYWKLTGRENLEFFASLYKMSPREASRRIKELFELMELEDKADEYVENYSSGMRQKLKLARALIHDPPVLLLDEPTLGLDPSFSRSIRKFIKEELNKREGKTILLTTHYMEEADQLCDRVALIHRGKIVACDTPENLKAKIGVDKVLVFKVSERPDEEALKKKDFVHRVAMVSSNGNVTIRVHTDDEVSALYFLLEELRKQKVEIYSFSLEKPTLEDVFIKLTGEAIRT